MEVTALLGRLALTQHDLSLAETCLQHALQLIERQGVRGFEHPVMVYLTAYHVLQWQDKLQPARKVLAEGYHYVTSLAAQIEEADLRENYLANVPEVREVCTLYKELEIGGGL